MNNKPKFRFNSFKDSWKTIKLKSVFEQTTNYVNPKLQNIELWSLTVEKGLTPKTERYNRSFLVKKEDQFKAVSNGEFIYNPMNMTLGAVDLNNTGSQVAVSGYYVTMKTMGDFDKDYFNVWLKTPLAINLYKSYATGSLIEKQRVQFPTFSLISTAVPGIDEQKKIGSFFKSLDETIALHQQELEAFKQTKQGFLQKMFPKEGEVVPKIRFDDFEENWETKKISEIATETFGGGTPKTAEKRFWSGDIPWIQSSDITQHRVYEVFPKKTISEEAVKSSATKLIPKDSIAVVTRVGVGKLALIEYDYSTSQDFVSLSNLKSDKWFTVYSLYRILQRELHNVQGTSIKGITKKELLEKNILLPTNNEEQVKIGEFFRQLDEIIELKEKEIEALKETKKGFLQKMFV